MIYNFLIILNMFITYKFVIDNMLICDKVIDLMHLLQEERPKVTIINLD